MKYIYVYFLFFFSIPAFTQDYVDLAKAYYSNTPVNQFDSTTNGTRIQEFGLDLTAPIKISDSLYFLTGLFAESISTKVAPENSNLTSVYTTNVKLGINIKHSKTFESTFLLLPKLSSDFKAIGAADFQIGAVALLKFIKHKRLNYKLGMYYNGELFGPFFVPILGLYYISENKKLEVNLALPISANINYALSNKLKTGLSFSAFVRTYHLNEPYQGNPDNYLTKTTNEIYGYLQYHATKSLIFQANVGYSIGRNYRIYDERDKLKFGLSAFKFGDQRKQLNADFQDGVILKLRFLYRFNL